MFAPNDSVAPILLSTTGTPKVTVVAPVHSLLAVAKTEFWGLLFKKELESKLPFLCFFSGYGAV